MSKRQVVFLLVVSLCLIIIGFLSFSQKTYFSPNSLNFPTPSSTEAAIFAKVIRVFDGDTIQIDTGQKVRYIGIDSPEVYPTRLCFSDEAREENEKLVLGKDVKLVKDVSETDKYGRLLRYVFVGDDFINNDLVKNGFAKVMTVSPDIKYENEFIQSDNYARENNLGLWGKCF